MIERRLIDTNLIVRFLTKDHEKHSPLAKNLFTACNRGEVVLVILPVVLAECVFVLESFYKHPADKIATTLASLITSPNVEIANASLYLDALRRYGKTRLHFVDSVLAASAAADNMPVASFDAELRKIPDVTVKND